MNRRRVLGSLGGWAAAALTGCGGGGDAGTTPAEGSIESFSADQGGYFVGDSPLLTARFRGERAEIAPGHIAVQSGVPVRIGPLAASATVRLIVTGVDGRSVSRDLALSVAYRGRLRTVDMGFARALHAGAELLDGRVAIFGGETGAGVGTAAVVHAFEPGTLTFADIGSLTSARDGLTATTLADGRVLVVGAPLLSGASHAELFDPVHGTSRPIALSTHRSRHSATALPDGQVLLAGGLPTAAALRCEIFDPLTESSRVLAAGLNVPRFNHAALALADGSVLVYGGTTLSGGAAPPERFDPATQRFELLAMPPADPAAQRVGHRMVINSAGVGYVLGGEDAQFAEPTSHALAIAPDGRGVAAIAAQPRPRSWHSATALTDGRVLLAGGFGTTASTELQATCDLLGAAGRLWTPGPSLSTPRVLHTAHRLRTGQVVIIGGNDAAGQVVSTAEIFD
jgi:hypothetical protein